MIGPLVLTIASVFKSAGLNQARQALTGASQDFNSFASSIGKAAGAFGAFQAIAGAREFVVGAVEGANKFERNLLGLQQVFESATPSLKNFIVQVEEYGLSQGRAAQASVFLGSVLKQYGLTTFEAGSQTQRLVTLAQDLATTYGYDVQEALLAITALFRGEYDPIEKFGVAMKQSEINAYLAAKGLGDLEGAELALAQAQARLTLLYQRSADAEGAFARATDTLYASQQRLMAVVENLQIAFGQPLQGPIAEVLNLFTEVAKNAGPQLVEVSAALGNVIETVAPSLAKFGELFLNLIALLQPVIELLGGLLDVLTLALNPALDIINNVLGTVVQFFDAWSETIKAAFLQLQLFMNGPAKPFVEFLTGLQESGAIPTLEDLTDRFNVFSDALERTEQNARAVSGDIEGFDNGAKQVSIAMRGSAYAAREARQEQEKTAAAGKKLTDSLKAIGAAADLASGSTSGLTQVLNEIEDAVAQSKAKEALEGLGLSAGLIEQVLTQPNWEAIFKRISRLAYLTSIDVSKVFSITALGQIGAEKAQIAEFLKTAFKTDETKDGGPAAEKPRDAVKELFDNLRDEVNKQAASLKLAAMGASQGLIDLILGDDDWSKLWRQIKTGVISLEELQRQFNSTSAGADELAEAMQAAADAKEAMLAGLNDKLEEATQNLANATQAAKGLEAALKGASIFSILPTVADEVGQFQSQIRDVAANVSGILREALDNGTLLQANYDELVNLANKELAVLEANARQRDELYKKYSFTENIIKEYRAALTGALSLTSLFNKLSKETEKRTVTEVEKGIRTLGSSVKEFAVTISKSYEETIDTVTNKTGGLLDGFRQMAEKSRAFANNLRALKEMGLDPQLFAQLVNAGVEAGGETAQAIVDGGKAAVDELGSIYNEIDKIGGELGLDMAPTFYNAGDKLMESLLSGIKAQQTALENTARTLATAFSAAFQANVTIAVQVPVTNAQTAATNAANAVNNVNTGAIERINALILQATEFFNSPAVSVDQMVGAYEKIGAYNALLQDLMSGQITDISGISAGMTSGDLRTAALATGGTNITNYYNVEVNASGYAGGVQAGQAVIEEIINFERNNGSSGRFLVQVQ